MDRYAVVVLTLLVLAVEYYQHLYILYTPTVLIDSLLIVMSTVIHEIMGKVLTKLAAEILTA
mgnify:CR=1